MNPWTSHTASVACSHCTNAPKIQTPLNDAYSIPCQLSSSFAFSSDSLSFQVCVHTKLENTSLSVYSISQNVRNNKFFPVIPDLFYMTHQSFYSPNSSAHFLSISRIGRLYGQRVSQAPQSTQALAFTGIAL